MKRRQGLTIIEVLIALAIIGVAFAALAFVQVTNLKASSRSRLTSQAKSAAETVLETQLANVLKVRSTGLAAYNDAPTGYKSYAFVDYYWTCDTGGTSNPETIKNPTGTRTALRSVSCTGSSSSNVQDGTVAVTWTIAGDSGPTGEGVIDITVTAVHSAGPTVRLSDRLSCYDVYPSPTIDTPAPCPVPEVAPGGGRTS